MLRSLAVLGLALVASSTAHAACTVEVLRPRTAVPSADRGQTFQFLASSDCTSLVFSTNRGAYTQEATFVESTDDGDLYQVRMTPMAFRIIMNARYVRTLTWTITGFGAAPSDMVRVVTESQLDTDRDGWTRSEGDRGSCDGYPWENPGLVEICGNGWDDDCDGVVDGC